MEVILLDDVVGLGKAGSVVKVKDGYGRNYLLPRGLAQMVTADVLNRVHLIERAAEERRRKRILEVKDKIAAMEGKRVVVPMKAGAEAKLFGAVTTMLISERIAEQYQMQIDRRFIELAEPVKYLGSYQVGLRAGSEAKATIDVVVVEESLYFSEGIEAAVAAVTAGAAAPASESEPVSGKAEEIPASEGEAPVGESPVMEATPVEGGAVPSADAEPEPEAAKSGEDAGDEARTGGEEGEEGEEVR